MHRFNYSAFSHSRGIQCLDKQRVIATLKAIHFLQAAAVSLKLLRFFFFFLICVRGGMSYLTLLPLESGGKNKNNFCYYASKKGFLKQFL